MIRKIFKNLINHDNKIVFLLIYIFLILDFDPLSSKCNFDSCIENKNYLNKNNSLNLRKNKKIVSSKKRIKIFSKNSFGISRNEIFQLNKLFVNILLSQIDVVKENDLTNFSYDIEADSQYVENDVYYAEGDVIIYLENGELRADKIYFDRKNKVFRAVNNILFKKGNQYFSANYIEYDFLNHRGNIDDLFGILDSKTIYKDLNFNKEIFLKNSCFKKDINLIDNLSEIGLLSSSNKRSNSDINNNKIKLDFSEIKKWKFKTKKIFLEKNKWSSDKIDFSNDPFSDTQFVIVSKNFIGEIINDQIKLKSASTFIRFDDKFTLPIGRKSINTDDNEIAIFKWGIGYQNDFRDGVYILRNFDTFKYKDNFSLNLKPYFLLQRAIQGESDTFRKKDSKVTSEKVNKEIYFADYFALNSELKGNFFNWDIYVNSDLKTFNYKNFYDALSIELNLLKSIYRHSNYISKNEDKKCINNDNLNYKEDASIDFGIYSLFEKEDIYSAYGGKLIAKYNFKDNNLLSNFSFILDMGEYQGKGLNDNLELVSLSKYGTNITLNNDFKIINFFDNNSVYSNDFRYTPLIPNQGLFLKTKISYGFYEYSNSKSQSVTSFSFGPNFIYGNLKNKLFDYTEISLIPEFISKNGNSPFKFDDFNNDSRIKFLLKQQFIGPFIVGLESEYNINTDSSNYGDLSSRKFFLQVSRRAYALALVYDEFDKKMFFGFEIFDFNNINFDKEFN